MGVVKTIRGRSGGVILALPPEEIVLGRVIRGTEPCFRMVEPPKSESEVEDVSTTSGLATILGGALNSFFEQLDKFTLADLLGNVDLVRISADEPIVLPTPIPSSPQL
ncbi:MAG: Rrf2 family nitric oxide-sensitive transcriptional repressor [Planctomycetota bacterium]